jgi:hypothetical protein
MVLVELTGGAQAPLEAVLEQLLETGFERACGGFFGHRQETT